MRAPVLLLCGLTLLAFQALPAGATSSPSPACDGTEAFVPRQTPVTHAGRLSGPISVDGKIQEAAWDEATLVTGFTEVQPGDQTQPDACTEVFVGYDENHLYLAFRAHDPNPASIRASMRNRDDIFGDDWIGLILDTYGDAAQAYEIFANPYGIQGDLLMSSTSGEDVGFDLVYQSEGRRTDEGYEVEMAIPFSSLRFPDRPMQEWRLTFLRTRPRSSRYQYSWATMSRDDPCIMCQLGTLTGIEGVQSSTKLDVIPALVGTQAADLVDPDVLHSGLDNHRVTLEPSVNLRYNFTPSLSAEATVNPDFSQVESDAARIDVNETFALSFPERRPFFQEGSELFDTWIDVIYTRSINAPLAAAKTTGRFGRTSVAYLTALDRETPMLLPFEEESATLAVGQSASNILRARRSFGDNSFVGGTLTDQRYTDVGGSGSVLSTDAKLQFWTNYRLEGQLAVSSIQEPDDLSFSDAIGVDTFARGAHTAALDGEHYAGTGAFLSLDRNARHWSFDLAYEHNSPTFRTPNGFERSNDERRLQLQQDYTFYFDNGVLERLEPGHYAYTEQNFAGVGKDSFVGVHLASRWAGQTNVWMSAGLGRERFRDVKFERLPSWNVNVNSNFSDPVRLGIHLSGGRGIFRTDTPQEGRRLNVGVWSTIQPITRLTIQPEANYARMQDVETGSTFFEGYVLRGKTSVQVSRELSMRLITQYNHFDGGVDLEPLLSYQINPFSAFHVGTTHDYGVLNDPTRPDAFPLVQTGRQFFFKLQYLFRL